MTAPENKTRPAHMAKPSKPLPYAGPSQDVARADKRWSGPRIALSVMAVALALLLGTVALFAHSLNSSISLEEDDRSAVEALERPQKAKDSASYMLIVGTDSRDDDYGGRSDVLILARIDTGSRTVSLVSIPRDTMVSYGSGVQKINAIYAYQGARGIVECVSEFAGVPISHFVRVNFTGLVELVDRLGGVEVDVPETVTAGEFTIYEGPQTLSGSEALAYARERYTASGGDFGRSQAQRLIVTALVEKVLATSPRELPAVVSDLAACVSTDYSVPDLVGLALKLQGGELTVYSAVVPSYTFWQDDVSYVGTMYAEWQAMMRRMDAGLDPADTEAAVPEPQASDEKLGAATNAASPRDYKELAAEGMTTADVAGV